MDTKKIVILGGGYAGVHGAKQLLKKLKRRGDVEITLIDKNNYHTLMTELHEVAGSRVEPDSVRVSFEKIFSGKKGITVVQDEIRSIDFDTKVLKGDKEYPYDYLLIGTGGEPADFNIPGISDHAFTLWSFEDAITIKHHIEDTFIRAAKELDPVERKAMLTFSVAGAGFTGVEMMGELLEVKSILCKEYGIDESEVTLILFEAMGSILTMLGEKQRAQVMKYLKKKGVEVHLNSLIEEVTPDKVCIKGKACIATKTLIWTCGVFGSDFGASLGLQEGHTKRQLVNKYMESPEKDGVYLAGDMIWFLEDGKPLPMIVETALQTAETATHNIVHAITGKKQKKEHKSNYHGFMVSVGGRWGVSNAMGIKLKGFFAMFMKHFVNLHYLIGVAGINVCWGYLKHEFLDMKHKRTFVGDHLSWKIQGFWAFPLRIWLGLMWVAEGWDKVVDGWLKFSSGSKSGWMFSPGVYQRGVAPPADGVAAASGAAVDGVAAASATGTDAVTASTATATDTVTAATTDAVAVASQSATEVATSATQVTEPVATAVASASEVATEATTAATQAVEPVVEAVASTSQAVTDTAVEATTAASDAVVTASQTVVEPVVEAVASASQSATTTVVEPVVEAVASATTAATQAVEPVVEAVASASQAVADTAVEATTAASDAVVTASQTVVEPVVEAVASASQATEPVVEAVASATATVSEVVEPVVEAVASATAQAADTVTAVTAGATDVVAAVSQAATDTMATATTAATQAAEPVVEAMASASQATEPVVEAVASASTQVADTVAAATTAVTDAVAAATQVATDAVVSASQTVAEATTTPAALWHWDRTASIIPYNSGFVTWFREIFMDSIASHIPYQAFQVMVVGVEIAVGLALMAGLLTFPAAVVSIVLCFVFMFSGMFSWAQLWFIFAAIVLLGGGGRALGLDHWVMPWCKNWWNKRQLAKRTYLYVDEPIKKKSKK